MSYTHKLIQILINQNEMNNKLICALSLAPPIKRFCLFVAGVRSALWGKIFSRYVADIFHAPAVSRVLFKKIYAGSLWLMQLSVLRKICIN